MNLLDLKWAEALDSLLVVKLEQKLLEEMELDQAISQKG